tara:strand:- start:176 stop:799 length:624 start_codon:yes stop_codon:yes gene_type:complete
MNYIDFYLALSSPWTYLGMKRVLNISIKHKLTLNLKPVNVLELFKHNSIKQVRERPKAVQANRLNELKRWKKFLNIPLNLHPKYFPVDPNPSAKLLLAILNSDDENITNKGYKFAECVLRAVWHENKDISQKDTLKKITDDLELNSTKLLEESENNKILKTFHNNTSEGIKNNVFGVPTFIYKNELFFGQDRLDFLDRKISNFINFN